MNHRIHIAISVLMASQILNAADGPPMGIFAQSRGNIYNATGDLNITNMDVTAALNEQMREHFKRVTEDRVFFEKTVNELEAMIADLQGSLVKDEFARLQLAAAQNTPPTAEKFMDLKIAYAKKYLVIQNRINAINGLADAFPTSTVLVRPGTTTAVPAYRSFHFGKVSDIFKARLKECDDELNAMNMVVVDKVGLRVSFKGLNIPLAKLTVLTPKEVETAIAEINALRSAGDHMALVEAQDKHTHLAWQLSTAFIKTMAVSERGRIQNVDDQQAQKRQFQEVVEVFWARSYLRTKYGIPMGAINAEWKKAPLRMENLFSKIEEVVDIRNSVIRSSKDLQAAREAYRQKISNLKGNADIFGSWSVNPTVMSRVNGIYNAVRGFWAVPELGRMTLQLLAADIDEESALVFSGGQSAMRDLYTTRYMIDEAARTKIEKLECEFDSGFVNAVVPGRCEVEASMYANITGPRKQFALVNSQMDVMIEKLDLARKKQEQLDTLRQAGNNVVVGAVSNAAKKFLERSKF